MNRMAQVLLLVVLIATSVSAQYVVSAHSGVINKAEGRVLLDGKVVEPKFAEFPEIKTDQTLATEDGRAEVLLTPGAFLRLDETSSIRMLNNKLSDTKVQIVSGTVILEVVELASGNSITLVSGETQIAILKNGVYRLDASPSRLRVYDGEARLTTGTQTITAKHGREVLLNAVLAVSSFNTKETDGFFRWSARRSEYIAKANISSANTSRGFVNTSSWSYNPWFGLYTFIPSRGTSCVYFGYCYYSPYSVYYLYYPPANYDYNRNGGSQGFVNPSSPSFDQSVGYNTSARSGSTYSGGSTPSSSAVVGSSSAAASGGSRGGGAATSSSAGGSRGH